METHKKDIGELYLEIAELKQQKEELLTGLEKFTIWPIHIEVSKAGLYPALEHANGLMYKYNRKTIEQ